LTIITNENIIISENNGSEVWPLDKSFVDIIMNPVNQRIAQYLILNKTGTVNDIATELSDVSKPSLYRHIKMLLDAGLIEVVEEKAVRGTVQKTYALVVSPLGEPSQKDIAQLVSYTLMSVMASFMTYFAREDVDMRKDMLSVSSSTLMLSDSEFMEMLGKIGEVFNGYIRNKPGEGRKPRNLVFISAPVNMDRKGE
jgi:DNA-binding transcriptional ArsR family regulator